MRERKIQTHSAEETQGLAEALGRFCQGGETLALVGEVGAGKTAFVQGLARGLGVPATTIVASPTFALLSEHQGRLLLRHLDLYRLRDADELEGIGWRDIFQARTVVAIEWADLFLNQIPLPFLQVSLTTQGEEERRIDLGFFGTPFPWWDAFCQTLDL